MEGIVAAEAKVKEEVEDEVVEVEVEEMVEEMVKEEVEGKVVEEKAVGEEQWLRGFLGTREAGAIRGLPCDPAVLAGPHPPNLDHPLLVPPESLVWSLHFLMQRVHQRILGQGSWVWVDPGWSTGTSPCGWGGGGGSHRTCPGGSGGRPPHPRKRLGTCLSWPNSTSSPPR